MRIVFFGSDDFAGVNLKRLIGSPHRVVAAVTQLDRAKGRGLKIGMCPIKKFSGENDIPVLQPKELKAEFFLKEIRDYEPDVLVVIAYGRILPDELLGIPKVCALNVHASLLPKYRGAAPINWAIIKGERETGVSVIKLNRVMDGGDVIFQRSLEIEDDDTSVTLRGKLACLGSDCLIESLGLLDKGTAQFLVQNEDDISFAPKLTKSHGLISWESPALQIHNKVRGLLPWPSAYTHFNGKLLKILHSEVVEETSLDIPPGTISQISKEGFVVSAGNGGLLVTRVHLESSRPMNAKEFLTGHKLKAGDLLI